MSVERVTIVIPAFNAARWVGRAIKSALEQDWPNVEVIVVNDGSTDNTEEVCLAFKNRIRYYWQENKGVSAARNLGISRATGELIAFLDADDELLPHMVSTLTEALRLFPEAGAASGAYLWHHGTTVKRSPPAGVVLANKQKIGVVNDFFRVYARYPLAWTGAVLVRRKVFEHVGFFREDLRLGEDIEMWTRIAGRFPWVFVDVVVAHYHQSPESSVTMRPIRKLDLSFIYTEQEMQRFIKPELWPGYRIFRRNQILQRCRTLFRYGTTKEVRAALSRIPPARINATWAVTWIMAVLPSWVVKPGINAGISLKHALRIGLKRLHRSNVSRTLRWRSGKV